MKEMVKKVMDAMGQVCSTEEKQFRTDYKKRMFLFDKLIMRIWLHGSQIWEWIKRDDTKRIQDTYIKFTLKLDRQTPSCILLEETKSKIKVIGSERQ